MSSQPSSELSSGTVGECHVCGKTKRLFHLTAEDIQRTRPLLITMVCEDCRNKVRTAARLETSYSTGIAMRDLALMVLVGFSLLLLWSNLVSGLRISFVLGTTGIILLVPVVVLFTGLRMAYQVIAGRYGLTHDFAWSLHSLNAMISLALILSGTLAILFHSIL